MKYQIFSENEWLYPDSVITEENSNIELYSARNADVCFQVLTDVNLKGGEECSFLAENLDCEVVGYQLLPAHVEENSSATYHTTLDYDSVKEFVTRQAPFDVYDMTRPLESGILLAGRAAFFLRLNVEADAAPGLHQGRIAIKAGEEQIVLTVSLKIYQTVIPELKDAAFHMTNWIHLPAVKKLHHVEIKSEEYYKVIQEYVRNQVDMRSDYLKIPMGEPVKDEEGKVIDFDFSHAAAVGNLALECGMIYLTGEFPATWLKWDDASLYLNWDHEVAIGTLEGYRQLKLYFTRAWECVCKNHWQNCYTQSLTDEPQFRNQADYRALSAICRKCMPGITILEAVETTDIAGALDIWAVKQATYEKYIDIYRTLQDMGEEMMIYSCGFPAGAMMNRVIDLPLVVSRLFMWVCYHYHCHGFLHFGYGEHNDEIEGSTCLRVKEGVTLPPGDAFIVYPAKDNPYGVWYSIRGHHQRLGAVDHELFCMLEKKYSFEKADELITRCCRGFEDYQTDTELVENIRHSVLELLG